MPHSPWGQEELILAFSLYCRTSFGRIHTRNPDIIELAEIIGRTPSAVSWKLANFASLDPALRAREIYGASHVSAADRDTWQQFHDKWEDLAYEADRLLAKRKGVSLAEPTSVIELEAERMGIDCVSTTKTRVGQRFFRAAVLSSYNSTCCITGLREPDLLNASHIVPWAMDARNRVNPRNGLCLNALHDRAFDKGLITITNDYRIAVAERLKQEREPAVNLLLLKYSGVRISLPERFHPDLNFLQYHREKVFVG